MGPRFEGTHEARNNTDSCGLVPLPTATLRTDPLRGVPLMSIRSALNLAGILALIILVAPGLVRPGVQGQTSAPPASPGGDPPSPPERVEVAGIENLYRLGPRMYSGGQPEGAAGFEALKRLGVRTIVSVDGARPDLDTAHASEIRYVHLPVGYDGVPRVQAVRLIQAMKTLPGPVFIHCHHGKHRGPTAVALAGIATEGWTKEQAFSWMREAGTSPDYRGLFASVTNFVMPSVEEFHRVGTELPERAKVAALVETMVEIDQHWDHLKAVRQAGYKAPIAHPDIDPPHEVLQLAENFRELLRLDATKVKGADFMRKLEEADRLATNLRDKFNAGDPITPESRKELETVFGAVGKSCSGCHARYRDD